MAEVQPIFARISDSKRVFGVTPSTMYRWINAGFVTRIRRGGCSFVRVEDVINFINNGEPAAA